MIKKPLVLLIFLLCLGNVFAEDDCTYDQERQEEYYQGLCERYEDCEYLRSENKVIIERGLETIEIMRGGCYDFGVTVTLTSSISDDYNSPDVVLQKALSLADEFWHDYVTGQELRGLVEEKKYQFEKTDSGYHYLFSHEYAIELMIEYSFKNDRHIIEISYYTNL